jgi:hypothetical protein
MFSGDEKWRRDASSLGERKSDDDIRMGFDFMELFSSRFRFLRGSTSCDEVDTETILYQTPRRQMLLII